MADLPQTREPAMYKITRHDGETECATLSNRKRQIVELLLLGPVHCASPVRISDIVFILKRDIGLEVETRIYPGDKAVGSGDYGVYFLASNVEQVDDASSEIAA